MIQLTELERDALVELFNIGLHRAAASLSDLSGQRIDVALPQLWIVPTSSVEPLLKEVLDGELATVHQVFRGAISGDAVFMLEYEKAVRLASVLSGGEAALGGRVDAAAREVLSEVGNIILGACLSSFGDVLKVSVSFSVPRIHIESLHALLRSIVVEEDEVQYALIAAAHFKMTRSEVEGYLCVVVGVNSIHQMARALMEGA